MCLRNDTDHNNVCLRQSVYQYTQEYIYPDEDSCGMVDPRNVIIVAVIYNACAGELYQYTQEYIYPDEDSCGMVDPRNVINPRRACAARVTVVVVCVCVSVC